MAAATEAVRLLCGGCVDEARAAIATLDRAMRTPRGASPRRPSASAGGRCRSRGCHAPASAAAFVAPNTESVVGLMEEAHRTNAVGS
ncbi:hypothetical protein VTN02DRAFT_3313 [Thermoascus thermophilus]